MSFYGDITNTSRTHFQFDRIYANRVEMDNRASTDGIYAGRFVLIEYNNETHMDSYLRVRKDENNNFYSTFSDKTSQEALLTKNNISIDTIVYESSYETSPNNGYYAKNCTFYKCIGYNANDVALFQDIVGENEEDPHITNYTIDFNKHGRGYDSTVWQKVYDGGIEKYIMVAELNTVIPTFDLQQDAPTQTPIVPHFDVQGSDIYYKLHHQPQWGFRVKSANQEIGPQFDQGQILNDAQNISYTNSYPAEPYQSDETTEWVRHEYNPNTGHISKLYWHSGNTNDRQREGTWQPTPPINKLPAAIYYNKAGFNPEVITKSTLEDHITVEGSGISGQQYSSHDAVGIETTYPDIQELSMMLPSIGNSVATMWDLIYGDESMSTEQTDDGKKKRNLDIDWNSTEGLRMVANAESGFAYNTKQVSTLAGAINSVHDLMGMIILAPKEPMNQEFAAKAEDNKIYYSDGEYYHRVNDYVYNTENAISAINEDRILTPEEITEISYYELNYNFNTFPPSPQDDNFYYGTPGQIYQLETKNYPTYNRVYYATKDKTPFFTHITPIQFDQGIHYKFETEGGTHSYVDENGETVTINLGYYVNNDTVPNEGINYYELQRNEIEILDRDLIPYTTGTYYIYNVSDNIGAEIGSLENGAIQLRDIVISNDPYNADYTYYTATIQNGELLLEKANVFGVTKNHYYQNLITGRYYRCSKDYIPNQDEVLNHPTQYRFVTIPDKEPVDYFYIPNKYYIYIEDAQEYRIYGEEDWDNSLTFYLRASNNNIRIVDLIAEHYYVANTYYYPLENQKMVIDRNKTASNIKYYLRDKILYVSNDENDIMSIGMEWNVNVTTIPKGITITTREEVPTMKKLEGFARELNTIHGLILEINRILLTNDIHTRDSYTIQGAINVINDIIDKFEIIAPGQFVIVDDYGRVHSATHSEDDWIDIEIDSNVINPNVSITHKFNPVNDTTSTSSQDVESSDGNIELYTPKVDNKGHIIGKNIETIELPHNFKSVTINDNIKIEADNHIANFNIKDGDRWINISATSNNDTITVSHGHNPITTYETSLTPIFGSSFEAPILTYDEKGHIATANNRTIVLPTINLSTTGSGNVLTGASLDLSKYDGALTISTADVGTLSLGTYNSSTSIEAISSTDTIGSAFRKLENRLNQSIDGGTLVLNATSSSTATTAISSTDTIIDALKKLENRIKALEK